MAYKFDDCAECRFRRKPKVCAECDCGEQFESSEIQEISFRPEQMFERSQRSLTNGDDESHFSPDDLVREIDRREEDETEEDEDE